MNGQCLVCTAPVTDGGTGCHTCATHFAAALLGVRELLKELTIAIAKQSVMGGENGRSSGEKQLPYDPVAAARAEALRDLAAEYATRYSAETGAVINRHDLSSWLAGHMNGVRMRDWFPDALLRYADAITDAHRSIDRPVERSFAGYCDACARPLFGDVETSAVTCACGASYDLLTRRAEMRDQIPDQLLTVRQIAAALGVPYERVSKWTTRLVRGEPRLPRRGTNANGDYVYALDDARALTRRNVA